MKKQKQIRPQLITLAAFVVCITTAIAAAYTYACPIWGLVQQHSESGDYKCPNDQTIMVLVQPNGN